jgi:hypothetical protein
VTLDRPSRSVRLIRAVACIGLVVLATSCRSSVGVGVAYQLPIVPIKFALTFNIPPNGPISVSGSVGIVTELGSFSVEAGIGPSNNNPGYGRPGPNETIVIIRHRSAAGQLVDSIYRIRTGEELVVAINGRTVLDIFNREIIINAAQSQISQLTVKNALNADGPVITQVTTQVLGVMIYVKVEYYDSDHDAAGFGFVGANGYGWAEEQHPFSSPSYGTPGADSIEYPFNSGCGTSQASSSAVQFWIFDKDGIRTRPVTVQLTCS